MLTCRDAIPLIVRDAEDTLNERGRGELAAHLHLCESCREEAAAQRQTTAVLRTRPTATASPGFAAGVAARLDDEVGWFDLAEWRTWTWRLVPVAAGLFAGALFVSGSGQSAQQIATASTTQRASFVAVSTAAGASSILLEDSATSQQVLVTVLTGSRSGSRQENRHE